MILWVGAGLMILATIIMGTAYYLIPSPTGRRIMKIRLEPVTWKELPTFAKIVASFVFMQGVVAVYAGIDTLINYPEWPVWRALVAIIGSLGVTAAYYGFLCAFFGFSIELKNGHRIGYPK